MYENDLSNIDDRDLGTAKVPFADDLRVRFCFLDTDCLVVGESQGSSRRSVGKYPVKPPRPGR